MSALAGVIPYRRVRQAASGCWLSVFFFFITGNVDAATVFSGKVTYVADGDTLWVQPDTGGTPRKLRIDGIDAPEICQAGGAASRALLAQMAMHQHVRVTVRRHDVYGRGLARVWLNGNDLGEQMVRSGQAWSYRWRRDTGPYAAEETLARRSGLGLFAAQQAELPRDFRKRHGTCGAADRTGPLARDADLGELHGAPIKH